MRITTTSQLVQANFVDVIIRHHSKENANSRKEGARSGRARNVTISFSEASNFRYLSILFSYLNVLLELSLDFPGRTKWTPNFDIHAISGIV